MIQESHQLTGLFGRVCAAGLAEPKKLDHVQAAWVLNSQGASLRARRPVATHARRARSDAPYPA